MPRFLWSNVCVTVLPMLTAVENFVIAGCISFVFDRFLLTVFWSALDVIWDGSKFHDRRRAAVSLFVGKARWRFVHELRLQR